RRVEPPQVAGADERVLVGEERGDGRRAEPVEGSHVETEAGGNQQRNRGEMEETRGGERALRTEAGRHGVEALGAVDVGVEERVEAVEARHPGRDRTAERPGLPRELPSDRDPGPNRGEAVHRAKPEVAEPGPALQVRV